MNAMSFPPNCHYINMVMLSSSGSTAEKIMSPTAPPITNSETGGKVSYTCMSGTGEDAVTKIRSGLDFEDKTYENNGVTWVGGVSDGFYCFATTVDDTYLAISIDFGGTMEEMETLIKAVEF